MNKPKAVRRTAWGAGAAIVICVIILTWSYVAGRVQRPADDQRILDLQEQVQADSSLAPELAAEHDRITARRNARKARADSVAILLIVASAIFIGSMKWPLSTRDRPAVDMNRLVQVSTDTQQAANRRVPSPEAPPEIDLSFVDEVVDREGRGKEAAIPILQAIQTHYRYLPDQALQRICELTEITPAQIAGTSSFYAQFRRSPVGKHVVRVCHGTACHVSGARQITEELRRHLSIPEGEDTDPDRMFTLDEVACLGCCSLAPVLMVDEQTAAKLTPASACRALEGVEEKEPA